MNKKIKEISLILVLFILLILIIKPHLVFNRTNDYIVRWTFDGSIAADTTGRYNWTYYDSNVAQIENGKIGKAISYKDEGILAMQSPTNEIELKTESKGTWSYWLKINQWGNAQDNWESQPDLRTFGIDKQFWNNDSFIKILANGTVCGKFQNDYTDIGTEGCRLYLGELNKSIKINEWSLYTMTWNKTSWKFYLNNLSVAESKNISVIIPKSYNDTHFFIGISYAPLKDIEWEMDDLRIYDRDLTPKEVSKLYKESE